MLTQTQITSRLAPVFVLVIVLGYGAARLGHPNAHWFYCGMLRAC